MARVLVVGSRGFEDYSVLKQTLDMILIGVSNVEIVSGGARGADSLARRFAIEAGYRLKEMPADWQKYGKSAGYIRNEEMHRYISMEGDRICIAFWDGESKGTKSNFDLCKRYKTDCYIYNYKNNTGTYLSYKSRV